MSLPKSSVNFSELYIKLFGPTLDDSLLYGVDRLMDFWKETDEAKSNSANEESCYGSCETLAFLPTTTTSTTTIVNQHTPHTVSKYTVPKLSRKEMETICGAISQAQFKNQARQVAAKRNERYPDPNMLRSRWAITRINEFDDGTKTFEIIKSANEELLPAWAEPKGTEIVFAMFKNGCTGSYRVCYETP
ncbi:hypothetical protein ZHAS_00016227 [Anopheles sinensis]|uniref:Uncharacterized protein n=1 Tax=Anopheles sinensis TaxID=74873 RepID=A0A084WD68_ANOSI|nr:hypothetical protein ZHAS_00016227 [Anopheles sinensis]